MRGFERLLRDEGATAIEYALLASAIAAMIVVVAYSIGLKNYQFFYGFDELFGLF